MSPSPLISEKLWQQASPPMQAAICQLVRHYEQQIATLQQRLAEPGQRLDQNSTNSSRPRPAMVRRSSADHRNRLRVRHAAGNPAIASSSVPCCRPTRSLLASPAAASTAAMPCAAIISSRIGTQSWNCHRSTPRLRNTKCIACTAPGAATAPAGPICVVIFRP